MSHARAAGFAVRRGEGAGFALGACLTVLAAYAAVESGAALLLGPPLVVIVFCSLVGAFVARPHVVVACTIPLFASIPTLKFVAPPIGAAKDVITAAAVAALVVVWIRRGGWSADGWATGLVAALLGLYVMNLGGGFAAENFGLAWFHGVRLVCEPLMLLLAGFGLDDPRRTLRWAIRSLVATAAGVACVGLAQQVLGAERLVAIGFDYNQQVRTIGDRLRSFGTLDEPFSYAAFLLFGMAALLFGLRRSWVAYAAGAVIAAGLAASLARTAAVVSIALIGVWLAKHGSIPVAILLGVASAIASAALLVSSGGTESQTVVAGSSTYLTINGRTEAWKLALGEPVEWPFGRGVGQVGTAAERARLTVSGSRKEDEDERSGAVDSGYFATVADVGLVGLAVLLGLLWRLGMLTRAAVARGHAAGWLAAATLTVLLIDALTRASFTAFPTAYLGFLLTGLALRSALEDEGTRAQAA